jgi:hypothetical protein
VFENFVNFIKAQKSVSNLRLSVGERRGTNLVNDELGRNNYREIFEHLLNLESLEEFQYTFDCKINAKIMHLFSTAKIDNPNVKRLDFPTAPRDLDFKTIARCFPNVNHLKIGYREICSLEYVEDYTSIKFMKNLEKLEINGPVINLIKQIESKNLREFVCDFKNYRYILYFVHQSEMFKIFVGKHPELESVHLLTTSCALNELKILVNKLPMLKSLKIKIWYLGNEEWTESMEKYLELIGKTYERIEQLDLRIEFDKNHNDIDSFEAIIKKSYPQIQFERIFSKNRIVIVIFKSTPNPLTYQIRNL